jgi:hypothetical protein
MQGTNDDLTLVRCRAYDPDHRSTDVRRPVHRRRRGRGTSYRAEAAMVGTVLLRAEESGTSATHQAALTDPARTDTVVTRALTGRPARGLRNTFIDTYEARAPLGCPAIPHLTSPLRTAAAAAGEPDLVRPQHRSCAGGAAASPRPNHRHSRRAQLTAAPGGCHR